MPSDFITGVRKYAKASMAIHKVKQLRAIDNLKISKESKDNLKKIVSRK